MRNEFSGKRRALIPPSKGYVNEKLSPLPEEVFCAFSELSLLYKHMITYCIFN
jgi:hypothetical protein